MENVIFCAVIFMAKTFLKTCIALQKSSAKG